MQEMGAWGRMATPLVWYDVSASVITDGNPVALPVQNIGTLGTIGNLSTPVGATAPTIITVNGLKALKFSQTPESTSFQRLVSTGLAGTLSGDKTYFLVAQYDPSGNSTDRGRIFTSTRTTVAPNPITDNWLLGHQGGRACTAYTSTAPSTFINGVEATDKYGTTGGDFQTNMYIYCLTQDTSGGFVISTMYVGDAEKIVFKGIISPPVIAPPLTTTGAQIPNNLSIGGAGLSNANGEMSDCIFCEARVYNGVLDQPTIASIMVSLRNKWGITKLLAPPTGLSLTGAVTIANDTYNGGTAINPAKVSGTLSLDPTGVDPTKPVTFSFSYPTTYTTKNAGSQVVNVPFSLTDTDNYTITVPPTAAAVITAAALSTNTSAFSANSRVYNRGTTATTSGDITFNGVVAGDSVTANVTSAAFADKDVGNNKNVTVNLSATAGSGTLLTNYNIPSNVTVQADITAAPLSTNTTAFSANSRVYNGGTTATTSGDITFNGVVAGDSVTANVTSAAFADKDVGNNKNVTVNLSATAGSGTLLTNYNIPSTVTVQANVTAAALTVTGVTANSKPADGTTTLTTSGGTGTLVGTIFGSDAPSVTSITASFPSPAVGCYSITGTANLTGSGSTNYSATANLGTACITGAPETPKAPIPVRNTEHGNATLIDDRKANAFVAAFQTPVAAGAPPRKPASASDYTAGLKAINAARFIR